MFDSHAIQRSFSRAAGRYDEHALLQRHVRELLARIAAPYFTPHARLLDLGCGTGAFAREAAQEIMQLDCAPDMCRLAAGSGPAACGNAEALPFADRSFDGIFSSLMQQWLNDPQSAWTEMSRVITPGGYIALSTLTEGTLLELRDAFAHVDDFPHISEFLKPHRVLAQAGAAGLSLVTARQFPTIEYYADAIAVMRALQAIGATNKHRRRRRGLMTPAQFARLEAAYERLHRQPRGLAATWQVLYIVLKKES